MEHTVIVKPADGTAIGWLLQYAEWNDWNPPKPVNRPIPFREHGGVFYGTIDLEVGKTWRLSCDIVDGHSVEIALDPPATIIWPLDVDWPISASGPTSGQDIFTIFFNTGAE
ncbi:hypothetical protein BH11PSE6_BH11PSE6_16310 [soil metagenome]